MSLESLPPSSTSASPSAAEPGGVEALIARGDLLLDLGRSREAAEAFALAVDRAPFEKRFRVRLASALAAAGDLPGAVAAARLLIEQGGPDAGDHRLLGGLLARTGDAAGAIRHCREALLLDPSDPGSALEMALLLLDGNGDASEAASLLHRVLRRRPTLAAAHYHLGRAWSSLAAPEASVSSFRRYLELDPADSLGAEPRIAELHGSTPSTLPPAYVRCLFDQYADRFDRALRNDLGYRGPELLHQVAVPHLGDREDLAVLDLGCGTGLAGAVFRDRAGLLCGVDLSPKMLEKARRRGIYHRLEVGEMQDRLRREDTGRWDLVAAVDVLPYLGDLATVFREAARVLRPGGLFAVSCEQGREPYELKATRRFGHGEGYLRRCAADAGLELLVLRKASVRRERGRPLPSRLLVARSRGRPG